MARMTLVALSAAQVPHLQDCLLANADRLLRASVAALDADDAALARSLAILGMEESGKAIAIHRRRVAMVYRPEGEPFVDAELQELWRSHPRKLQTVHAFLVDEEYWFDVEPPDHEATAMILGAIDDWAKVHNSAKQRGFYVDVTPQGDPVTPDGAADADEVRAVLERVHQIGWQLRQGEHIEGKKRLETERDVPPASAEHIEDMRHLFSRVDEDFAERMIEGMATGRSGRHLNNAEFAFDMSTDPLRNFGRPGYEAHDRALRMLAAETGLSNQDA